MGQGCNSKGITAEQAVGVEERSQLAAFLPSSKQCRAWLCCSTSCAPACFVATSVLLSISQRAGRDELSDRHTGSLAGVLEEQRD